MINLEKRIPTVLGVFVLLSAVLGTTLLTSRKTFFSPKAEEQIKPLDVKISNISDRSFTVSWYTQKLTTGGAIIFGIEPSQEGKKILDMRDQQSGVISYYDTHYVTIGSLLPSKEYSFAVESNGEIFDNQGVGYRVKTKAMDGQQKNDLAWGEVKTVDDSPAVGAIVYYSFSSGADLFSSLVSEKGYWLVSRYNVNLESKENVNISVQAGGGGMCSGVSTTDNDSPSPPITLGKNFDFTKVEVEQKKTIPEETGLGFKTDDFNGVNQKEFKIINPEDGGTLFTLTPQFFGTGNPGAKVKISVYSTDQYERETTIGENGEWYFNVDNPLSPGVHTLAVEYINSDGKSEKIMRSFVLAQENLDLPSFSSSPSGATATPTSKPTPSPTPILTATPVLAPTATPTLASKTARPDLDQGIPDSGYLLPMVVMILGGAAMFSLALLL